MCENYSMLDDIILFENDNFRFLQNIYGKTHSEVLCPKCKEWHTINFEKMKRNINGIEVGKRHERKKINYTYKVNVCVSICIHCGYICLYDKDGNEFTDYDQENPIEICTYRTESNQKRFKYPLKLSKLMAKYTIGYIHENSFIMEYGDEAIGELLRKIQSGSVVDRCLFCIILCDLMSSGECTYANVSGWYRLGVESLSAEIRSKCEIIADLLL